MTREAPRRPRVALVVAGAILAAGALAAIRARRSSFEPLTIGSTLPIAATPALEMEPAISPDGKLVAYAAETPAGWRIFVRQVDGGRPIPLTADLDGDHRWPRWSPDQSRIVFTAHAAAYVVPALGGTPQRVIESPNDTVRTPAWSPDGRRIAYGDADGIFVHSLGGAARKVVGGGTLHSPSWSPDGTRLAYARGIPPAIDNMSTNVVYVVAEAGGAPRRLSDSIHVNVSPVWAPDGRSVLYVSNRGGTLDVYQQPVRSDGSPAGEPSRLTTTLHAHAITLSGNGARMVYDVVVNRGSIWAASLAPGAVARTSSAARVRDEKERIEGLSLSHDGRWLAYDSDRGGTFDIYKVRVDGGLPTRLTTHPSNDFLPTWSPDDREIAFHSPRNGTRDVYVMSAEGGAGGETQVTSGAREDFSPGWSPDGRSLVFRGSSGGAHRAYVVTRDPTGRWSDARVVTPDSVRAVWINQAWSPDGQYIAYMHRGAVAVTRPDGRGARVLADSVALGGSPEFLTWGSDPSALYVAVDRGGRNAVVAVPVAGGRPRTVMIDDGPHRMPRDFATDGHRIFFRQSAWESDVWVMDLRR